MLCADKLHFKYILNGTCKKWLDVKTNDKHKLPYPETGRRQSNGTRRVRKDTGGQQADCGGPPRFLLPLLPTHLHI